MALDSFQREVLEAFFQREQRFFLTGGAALAAFHLAHRTTKDLDLFTTEDILDDGVGALRELALELGASIEAVRTSATFRRFLIRRGDQAVVVDLVYDLAPQLHDEKLRVGAVRLDSADEILANKLCALLSRSELRDIVDVYVLAQRGHSLEDGVRAASKKDGGMTPGQLAWVISGIQIGDDATPPGGVTVAALRTFLDDLRTRLVAMALPP